MKKYRTILFYFSDEAFIIKDDDGEMYKTLSNKSKLLHIVNKKILLDSCGEKSQILNRIEFKDFLNIEDILCHSEKLITRYKPDISISFGDSFRNYIQDPYDYKKVTRLMTSFKELATKNNIIHLILNV